MSINLLRQYRRSAIPPRPTVNTMEIQQTLAMKQPVTVKEKKEIIEGKRKKDVTIDSVQDIITLKPSAKKVRDFFKNRVNLINEEIEDNM